MCNLDTSEKLNSASEAVGETAKVVFILEKDAAVTQICKIYKFPCGKKCSVMIRKEI